MSVKDLLDNLSLKLKTEGSQLVIDCPACGKVKHCYVNDTTGLWDCKVCGVSGNSYQLIKHLKPTLEPKEVFTMLEQHGLNDGSQTEKQPAKPKDLSWLRDKLRKPTEAELQRLCIAKGLSLEALRLFRPYITKGEPIAYLPVFTPGDKKACGFLRVHLDGELITLKSGSEEKYPVIGSHGLFPTLNSSENILFTEGWRDCCMSIEVGFNAVASSGGASTWRDSWLAAFKGKNVMICMDADEAGVRAAHRAAERIITVAKQIKIVKLPYKVVENHGRDVYDYFNGKDK